MSQTNGKHLIYEIRCQIDVFFSIEMSRRRIGKKLCIHHSTIAREIKRNSGKKGYKFQEAEAKKQKRRALQVADPID